MFDGLGTVTNRGLNFTNPSTGVGTPYAIQAIVVSGSQRALTIGSSAAAAGILRLTGATINSVADVVLRNSGTTLLTIQSNIGSTGPLSLDLGDATNNVILLDNSGGITISATVTGVSRTLTLAGSGTGTLTLSAANTYTGTTVLNAATNRLLVGNANALGASGNALVVTSGTLDLGGTSITVGVLSGGVAGRIMNSTAANTATLTATSAVSSTFSGVITDGSGTLALVKQGTGRLLLDGTNAFTGSTTVTSGTLEIGGAGSFGGGTYNGAIAVDGVFSHTSSANQTLGGVISGTGSFLKSGASRVTLTGVTSYSGNTTIASGTFELGGSGQLGSGIYSGGIANDGAFRFNSSAAQTLAGGITGAGSVAVVGSGTLTLTGTNTYSGGTTISSGRLVGTTAGLQGTITNNAALTFDQATSGTFTGAISGAGTVRKAGTGTVTFSGTNTFGGATTIDAGTLVANGPLLSTAITVNAGGVLGGSGTTGGVTINSGGVISPGTSPGVLTTGGMTWNGGGVYDWEMYDFQAGAGVGWDLISGTAALTVNATAGSTFSINLLSLSGTSTRGPAFNWSQTTSGTFRIATFTGGISAPSGTWWTLNTGSFSPYNATLGTFSLAMGTNDIDLVYIHTPLTAYTWVAGSGDWSVGTNWDSDPDTPEGNPAIIFSGAGGTSNNDITSGAATNQLAGISGLTFSGSAGPYTLTGNTLSLGVGGIVNNSAVTQTIQNAITLQAASVIDAAAGGLAMSGTIDTAGFGLTVQGSASTSLGAVSNAGSLTKAGAGTALLVGPVDSATVTVAGGMLAVGASNAIGNTATVTVSGGIFDLAGFSDTVGSFIITSGMLTGSGTLTAATTTLAGGTVAASATLGGGTLVSAGGATLAGLAAADTVSLASGTLTLGSAGRFIAAPTVTGSAAAAISLAGSETLRSLSGAASVVVTSGTLSVGTANGSASYTGIISGAGGLTKAGTGLLMLGGTNTYMGATTISSGTLEIVAGGSLTATSAVMVAGGATLAFSRSGTFVNAISGSGGLRLSSGTLALTGTASFTGGTIVAGGSLVGTTASLQGGITNNAAVTFDQATTGTYAGSMTGAGVFTKAGSGTVALAGDNSGFSGGMTISAGSLVLAAANAIGSGTVTINGGTLSADSTARTIANPVMFTGIGGLGNAGAGSLTLAGPVTFNNATQTVTVGTASTATLSGVYGSGGISKAGPGSLVFASSGTLSALAITGGTMTIPSGVIVTTTSSQLSATGGQLTIDGTLRSTVATAWAGPSGKVTVGAMGAVVQDGNGTGVATFATDADVTWTAGSTLVYRNFSGTPSVSGQTFRMNVAFDGTGSPVPVGSITGSGTWTVQGNFTIGENVTFGFGSFSGTVDLQQNVIVGGTFGTPASGARGFTVNAGRELRLDNAGGLNIAAAQAVTISGSVRTTATAGQMATIAGGTVSLGGGVRTFAVSAGSGAAGLTISSAITGGGTGCGLTKTGGGFLALNGVNDFAGPTTISEGRLALGSAASLASTLITVVAGATLDVTAKSGGLGLVSGQTLAGAGLVTGTLSGAGLVSPGISTAGILTAGAIAPAGGLDFTFMLSGSSPAYGSAAASGNDLVRLTDAAPFVASLTSGNGIDVYFNADVAAWTTVFEGGFFSLQSPEELLASVANATFNYYAKSAGGAITYEGVTYAPLVEIPGLTGVTLTARSLSANFGAGAVSGSALQFVVVPEPGGLSLVGIGLAAMGWAAGRRGPRHSRCTKSRRTRK